MSIPACGKGTRKGEVAQHSRFLFAPCILPNEHGGDCDSGKLEQTDAFPHGDAA
jgi:hypothetical protein